MDIVDIIVKAVLPKVLPGAAADSAESGLLSQFISVFATKVAGSEGLSLNAEDTGSSIIQAVFPQAEERGELITKLAEFNNVDEDTTQTILAKAAPLISGELNTLAGGNSLQSFLGEHLSFLGNKLPTWAANLIPSSILGVIGTLGAGAAVAAGKVGDVAGGAVDAVGNVAGGAVDAAANVAGGAVDAAGNVVGAAGDLAKGAGGAVVGAAGAAAGVAGAAVDKAGDVAGAAVDAAGDAVGAAGDLAKGAAGAVVGAAGAAADTVGDVAGAAVDVAGDAVGAAGDLAKGAAGAAVGAAGAAVDTVGDVAGAAVGAAGDAVDAAGDLAKGAAGAAVGAAGAAAATGGGLLKKLLPILGLIGLGLLAMWLMKSCSGDKGAIPPATEIEAEQSNSEMTAGLTPANFNITTGEGDAVFACNGNVGEQGLKDKLLSAVKNVFGSDDVCQNVRVNDAYTTELKGLDNVEAGLAAIKAVPNASAEFVNGKLVVNAPDAGALEGLVAKLKEVMPGVDVAAAAPLNIEEAVKNSVDSSLKALNALDAAADSDDIARALNLQIINFAVGKSDIPEINKQVLNKGAEVMQKIAGSSLGITGHTDSTGNAAANNTLSDARAASVKSYLVAQGVNADSLTTAGVGSSQPVADNATDLGRFRNRRISFSADAVSSANAGADVAVAETVAVETEMTDMSDVDAAVEGAATDASNALDAVSEKADAAATSATEAVANASEATASAVADAGNAAADKASDTIEAATNAMPDDLLVDP